MNGPCSQGPAQDNLPPVLPSGGAAAWCDPAQEAEPGTRGTRGWTEPLSVCLQTFYEAKQTHPNCCRSQEGPVTTCSASASTAARHALCSENPASSRRPQAWPTCPDHLPAFSAHLRLHLLRAPCHSLRPEPLCPTLSRRSLHASFGADSHPAPHSVRFSSRRWVVRFLSQASMDFRSCPSNPPHGLCR